jgi:hypothetical protein
VALDLKWIKWETTEEAEEDRPFSWPLQEAAEALKN